MGELLKLFLALLLFFGGASIFSFLNVVIYRVPRGLPFVRGHSRCPFCRATLGFRDMIPAVGWLLLGGRCRYCGAPISVRYPVVETLGGALALLVAAMRGVTADALLLFAFFSFLTAVAFVDADTMEIPNGFVLGIFLLALLRLALFGSFPWTEHWIGFFAVSLPLFLLTLAIPGAFGGGDIKLLAACGLYLGWRVTLLSFFFAVLFGGSYGIWLLASGTKGKKEHFPFGPFLCVAMGIGELWGMQLWQWYRGFFPI